MPILRFTSGTPGEKPNAQHPKSAPKSAAPFGTAPESIRDLLRYLHAERSSIAFGRTGPDREC